LTVTQRKQFFILGVILLFTACDSEPHNSLPAVSFDYNPQNPIEGEVVSFDASSSSDHDGVIIAYDWNFGDGETGVGELVTHYYDEEGIYLVSLTVVDDDEGTSTAIHYISIGSAMVLSAQVRISVEAPSGLVLSTDKQSLWTVSDKTGGLIYQMSIGGDIVTSLPYNGSDLEGITMSRLDSSFWVIEEASGEMVQVGNNGEEIQRVAVPGSIEGSGGLEGITIRPEDGHFYMLKEKDPGVLIELDDEFNLVQYTQLYFAEDYSGIDYDPSENTLWIISDQDGKVFQCDLSGNVIEDYSINISKAEGIAVDIENRFIYIVSDSEEKLFVYEFIE
jgi:uncharacterized protein YjiK